MNPSMLYLLRHGAPRTAGRMMGRTDDPPTAEGVAACVEQVDGLALERLISSGLARSDEPARAIGGKLGLPVVIDPRWQELDFGAWDGLASDEIDSQALGLFWRDPDAHPPPDGERWSTLVDRVRAAIGDLDAAPALIVTHAGAMRAALAILCGFDHRQVWAIDLPYASLLALKLWPGDAPSAQIMGLWP